MKTPRKLISLSISLSALAFLLTFSQCKKDKDPEPEPTEKEKVTALLTAATWPLTSVTVEGENAAALFTDFSINFTSTAYTTTGTTPVWARSGTWTFTDDTAKKIIREDGVEITIESVDEHTLKLTLFWEQEMTTGGRAGALRGKHEFVLSK